MSSVESSAISKRYLLLVTGIHDDSNEVAQVGLTGGLSIGDYDNFADAISALNIAQTADNASNYYVVEAWTCLPNPASS